ncbi:TetR/AcrR family transcriptional regulator [Oenococcus sp. UCMA 16435]|nr:TetR/AcrR family transcriptional regulator [Oenococcus sp. UCMA 16435]MDI4584725.1 TetR family transcriptional regulator [Oenococcus sp. UCMA 14587]
MQRRTKQEIINSIYKSTLEILNDKGYKATTFQNVAHQAGTARAVLYRHWESPFELINAAMDNRLKQNEQNFFSMSLPGISLRGDLIFALSHSLKMSKILGPEFFRAFLCEAGKNNNIQERLKHTRQLNLSIMGRIIEKAKARGEISQPIDEYLQLLPFDMLRYEVLINEKSLTSQFIEKLVDDVVLPSFMKEQKNG